METGEPGHKNDVVCTYMWYLFFPVKFFLILRDWLAAVALIKNVKQELCWKQYWLYFSMVFYLNCDVYLGVQAGWS